ncbi:MAG: phosphopentomutase [Bacillota bacterium]|jgi:phosphopentomutase|nr:phosphopentomutase [Bacillota bacterium]NLU54084.1 phosphopentomutase [Bacillota bacterium]HOA91555.1 phosphopentomutase [Bacillota bacterium]HPT61091.1 phosphopentomutase [Bacillota bacterium]HPZ73544.1 phosphopentomutase [Bacillota bacterium]
MGRFIVWVLDSVGIGEMPDSYLYNDQGSATLQNIARERGGLYLPNLERLGLGLIEDIFGVGRPGDPQAAYGKMAEQSKGKDTTTGHWEIAGLHLEMPFPTYPNGFPEEVISRFEKEAGVKVLGNYPASGTVIIEELGDEHMRTQRPIVYTSADSVFQIAAHIDVIPLERLYELCEIARGILVGEHGVARVIARPFAGEPGSFYRTKDRRDYSLPPTGETILDVLVASGVPVTAIGKISDIFTGRGISTSLSAKSNNETMSQLLFALDTVEEGLIFANSVDFDMVYGHRNDVEGYAKALEETDRYIPDVLRKLRIDDILVITADHGCDPTTQSTDHSREYVPLLVYGIKPRNLGIRETFADVAQSIAEYFGVSYPRGKSFLGE